MNQEYKLSGESGSIWIVGIALGSCHNLSTADVDLMTLKQNDKGEIEEKDEDFSPVVVLSKNQYQKFLDKKAEPVPTVTSDTEVEEADLGMKEDKQE